MKRALLRKIAAVFLLIFIIASALPMYAAADADAPENIGAAVESSAPTPTVAPETPTETEKPVISPPAVEKPEVELTAKTPDKLPETNQELELLLNVRNLGKVKISAVSANIILPGTLTLTEPQSPASLGDIEAGQTQSLRLKLKLADKIDEAQQSITVELKYSYNDGDTPVNTGSTQKIKIEVKPTQPATPAPSPSPSPEPAAEGAGVYYGGGGSGPDSPVPHIIITEFEYGGESVVAGKKFSLGFSFENAGKLKIENIVMTVDGGESFAMDGSTNTFYYSALASGTKQSQKLPLQTLATAKTGAQSVGIGFKYEYLDGSKRASAAADIKLSMPVYQPDRFQINSPIVPETVNTGEELAISLSYVNKGKGDVSNVEATVEGDGVDTPAKTQYLGNISPGSSGNIGFALTPNKTGTVKLTLTVSYEGTDMQVQTKSFPVTLTVAEGVPDDMLPEPQPENPAGGVITWIAAAVLIGGGGGAGFYFLRRHKRISQAMSEPAADWSAWDDEPDLPPEESKGEKT